MKRIENHSLFVTFFVAGLTNSSYGVTIEQIQRLNNMSDKKFLEIKDKHYLAAMYAHLTSLSQIERLAMLKSGEALTKDNADMDVA